MIALAGRRPALPSPTARGPAPGRVVPMYVHPVVGPPAWRRVLREPLGTGFVVVNAGDGPGTRVDPEYTRVLGALADARQPVAGYVDLGYGRRGDTVAADALGWQRLYGIHALFVDQVPAEPDDLAALTALVHRLRAQGADRITLNPGVVPDPGVAALGDILVTFEGPWADHLHHAPPAWLRARPAEEICHLVHGVPAEVSEARAAAAAAAAGAGIVGLSRHGLPNPWRGPPADRDPTP